MRRVTTTLALALCLLGCSGPRGEQVPLITVETAPHNPAACLLVYEVVDVVANSTFGTAIKGSGLPLKWPSGFTGWSVGSEVEVLDRAGEVALTTGSRYRLMPVDDDSYTQKPISEEVVCDVQPCPDCELGAGAAHGPALAIRDPVSAGAPLQISRR